MQESIHWVPPARVQMRDHMCCMGDQGAQTVDQTCNLAMCPNRKSNPFPFAYGMVFQPNEPHWGKKVFCFVLFLIGDSQWQLLSINFLVK